MIRDRLETEHGIFTANHITGQTAKEVYQEWLVNKDNKTEDGSKTTKELTKENTELKTALADTQDLLIEMSHSIF